MEEYILIRPTGKYANQIMEYRQEFLDAGDSMDGTGSLRRIENPEEYIKICEDYEDPKKVPSYLVSATQFLFIRISDNRLVGMIQVRHRFNDYLEKYAGHIGYSIRPSERTILANGGVYESTVYEPNENLSLKRFWITP